MRGKDIVAASPAAGMTLPTQERPRDRVLSDDELLWLWQACDEIGWPFGPYVKLLLLTAQRRDEAAGLERAEVDLEARVWTIPGARAKNGRLHEVQLSQEASRSCAPCPIGERLCSPPMATSRLRGSRMRSGGWMPRC